MTACDFATGSRRADAPSVKELIKAFEPLSAALCVQATELRSQVMKQVPCGLKCVKPEPVLC